MSAAACDAFRAMESCSALTTVRADVEGLALAISSDQTAFAEMAALASQAAKRTALRDVLHAGIEQDIATLQTCLIGRQDALDELQQQRARDAAAVREGEEAHRADIKQLTAALEAERAARAAAEGKGARDLEQAKSQQAVMSGVMLKMRNLEAELKTARSAVNATEGLAEALRAARDELHAITQRHRAEQQASEAAQREALQRALSERERIERDLEVATRGLEEAKRLCATAGDECVRVRRRNTQMERELASLRQRCGVEPGGGGMEEVMESLDQMEQLVKTDQQRSGLELRRPILAGDR